MPILALWDICARSRMNAAKEEPLDIGASMFI
jgi:hypothetical protein